MSDQDTSGEPSSAPATAPGAAPAAPSGDTKPIGSFGNARGSGLSRGKRPAQPAAAFSATPAPSGGYKPTSVEVITPQREYTNPFAPEVSTSAPVNEPAPQAAPEPVAPAPVAIASESAAVTAPAPVAIEPITAPAAVIEPSLDKAEIKILPPAEAKRPAVSWGEPGQSDDTRPAREARPTFQPERREPKKFEPREPRKFEPREPRSFEPRNPSSAPRNTPGNQGPRPERDRPRPPERAPEPAKESGGFLAWLKGLFTGKPAETPATPAGAPDRQNRDGEYPRRRHRGGRGRGGYQGENRGPRDNQPRDPRDEVQNGSQEYQGGDSSRNPSQGGDHRFEGGGGRRRRRGGRGRFRDDRGGPSPEGQQGGGAI